MRRDTQQKPKDGRGGKRPGAGRTLSYPSEGKTQTIAFTTPASLVQRFDAIIHKLQKKRSQALTELMLRFVETAEQRAARKAERQRTQQAKGQARKHFP